MYKYPIRSDELYHYGIKRRSGRYPYGSGERPFQDINSSAASVYKIAIEKEKAITKDIKEAAKASNSKLYGLENRLKTVDSIQRKINKRQIEDNKTEKESMESIHDSVRYTTISDTEDFVSNYELFKKQMNDLGYIETECKNYFNQFNEGLVKHKAVQSQFSDKDGFTFEVQFQTPESQKAKTEKIPLYEERRKVGINPSRAKELEKEMEMLALKVPDPPDIEKIKSHSNIKHSQEGQVKFKMTEYYYISHGGPGSGRYPLGSGDRPYQKFEKSRRGFGGISGYIQSRKARKAEAQRQKEYEEAQRKRIEYEKEEKRLEADKERVLRSGTAQEVMRYKGRLTNQELGTVAERLRLEKQISGYSSDEIKTALDKMKTIQAYTNVGAALAKDGVSIYNSFVSLYNSTSAGKKDPLTPVKEKGDGGGKKKGK